jgi:hypothetical protein
LPTAFDFVESSNGTVEVFRSRPLKNSSQRDHVPFLIMAILTPTQHSSTVKTLSQSNYIISALYPALTHSLKFALLFQRLLSTTTFFVCARLSIFTLYTTKLLLLNALYASKLLVLNLLIASKVVALRIASAVWKHTEKARRKLFFELMLWILNPNAVALFVFWPGWIVLAGIYFACQCFR